MTSSEELREERRIILDKKQEVDETLHGMKVAWFDWASQDRNPKAYQRAKAMYDSDRMPHIKEVEELTSQISVVNQQINEALREERLAMVVADPGKFIHGVAELFEAQGWELIPPRDRPE